MKIKKEYSDEKKRVYAIKKIWRDNNKNKIICWRENIRFGGNVQKVLERDNFQCQKCGMTQEQHIIVFGIRLNIHHKDGSGWGKKVKNNHINNLLSLCRNCHSSLHTKIIAKKKWFNQDDLKYKYPDIRDLVGEQIKKGFGIEESKEIVAKNIGLGYSSIMQKCSKRKKVKLKQDCSSVDTRTAKEDTGDCTLPADSKYNEQWDSHYDEEKDIWLEPQCQYEDCEYCNDRPTKPSECKK